MPSLKHAIDLYRARWLLPRSGPIVVKDLVNGFNPIDHHSVRSLLEKMLNSVGKVPPNGGSHHPYYRRVKPVPQSSSAFASDSTNIDLTKVHMAPYDVGAPVAEANRLFDQRAAAAVHAAVGSDFRVYPNVRWLPFYLWGNPTNTLVPHHVDDRTGQVSDDWGEGLVSDIDFLEMKFYGENAPTIYIPTAKCLPALAYLDYFPDTSFNFLPLMVSQAILAASPGWCGTFGPAVDSATDLASGVTEGNYDMSEMHLLQIAYRHYDEIPAAREHLISPLLAWGRIHRPNLDDTFTRGGTPNDWSRAGYVSPGGYYIQIGETENHNLMILTARYLTNQLLYQRTNDPIYDNRRNGNDLIFGVQVPNRRHCMELLLDLLRNILRDDFSEYNAKNYQTETRSALLNLCSYAYDHEVRLAARMVLDYVAARLAVSSCDLRRMVPFRRRNEGKKVTRTDEGYLAIGLLETTGGADPMAQQFAILAGNTRIYGRETIRHPEWTIFTGGSDGNEAVIYALSDYRLPPSIHDLFVSDPHRRFYQRLHRTPQDDVKVTGRNADNYEIYAGSPSYLISAGGEFATWAIDPGPVELSAELRSKNDQQLGVAVPSSFIPTTRLLPDVIPLLNCGDPTDALDQIQFGCFSDVRGVFNYGVAPDFACGHQVNLPLWCKLAIADNRDRNPGENFPGFEFVDRGSGGTGPGFFLAFFRYREFAVMEAWDTWLHKSLTFDQFKRSVHASNGSLYERGLHNSVPDIYRTQNGNTVRFVIWNGSDPDYPTLGAKVLSVSYGETGKQDSWGDASEDRGQFLNGTVLNSREDEGEGIVEISNGFLGTKIRLDMSDPLHPRRTSEQGVLEAAGSNQEVWVNFGWTEEKEGDFFHPFNSLAAAAAAVADGGVIKIMPGWTNERPSFRNKRIKLVAPIGGVTFGVR